MKVLLLDLDGTLTNPRVGIVGSLRHALRELGQPPPPDAQLETCIGPPLRDSFGALLGRAPDDPRVARAIALYRERFDARGWRENEVYPGVPAFLDEARERGFALRIATSKPTVFAQRIADHFGFADALDGIHGASLDESTGEKYEVIAEALAEGRISPADAVMIGDRRHDVAGAAVHGIPTLGVTWGFGSRQELTTAGARWICDAPERILAELARG